MRKVITILVTAFAFALAVDARINYWLSEKGALAKVKIKVIDQDGVAVPRAKIWGCFTTGDGFDDYALVDAFSDTNGEYVAQNKCNERLRLDVTKEGYYRSNVKIDFARSKADPLIVDGKWQPYGETRTVVLKRIKNPISIGGFGRCSMPIPSYDEWVGFDFEKRMWTPPYGDGRFADVLLRFGRSLVDRQTDFKMTMDVSFTNNPHAGCYQVKYEEFSERKNVYHADVSAVYTSEMNYVQERHPGSPRNDNRIGWDSYMVFRTRTRVDENGKLVSAHYGIIGGCWSFYGTMLSGGYLFNPTPNDTNLEDAETARLSRLGYKQQLEFERRQKAKGK